MRPTPIDWTADQIAAFWDYVAQRPDLAAQYFTLTYGTALTQLLELAAPLAGREVLDYGSGPGHLTARLLDRGALVSAADFSPLSVDQATQRFAGLPGWRGAQLVDGGRLPYDDDRFDVVCCIETIEHVPAEPRAAMLAELRRVARPGGVLLITTPCAEDLAENTVCCPACGTEFHRWQHLHRYTAESAAALLAEQGLTVRYSRGINLAALNAEPALRLRDWSMGYLRRRALAGAAQRLDSWRPRPLGQARSLTWGMTDGPHLVLLAIK